ncbi:MAG: hypothetical protein IT350_18605 [Deltaproteobacteria bacterium]|nr:hypothetical protein [Deltaproteobacteria bacterium]
MRLASVHIRLAALIALAAIVGWHAPASADDALPANIRVLEQKHELVRNNLRELVRQRTLAHDEVRRLASEIDRIKAQGEPGFIDRRRLERLQAESLEAGKRMEDLVAQVDRKQKENDDGLANLYRVYTAEMEKIADRISGETKRAAVVELARDFARLRDRREQFRPPGMRVAQSEFMTVELGDGDTPSELAAKRDLLQRRKARLAAVIANLKKEIAALRNDKALADQMRTLVIQEQLIEDGVVFSPGSRGSARTGETPAPGGAEGGADPSARGHVSPLEDVGDRADLNVSIEDEIARLEKLLEYLRSVEKQIDGQIQEIQRRLRADVIRSPVPLNTARISPKGSNP